MFHGTQQTRRIKFNLTNVYKKRAVSGYVPFFLNRDISYTAEKLRRKESQQMEYKLLAYTCVYAIRFRQT